MNISVNEPIEQKLVRFAIPRPSMIHLYECSMRFPYDQSGYIDMEDSYVSDRQSLWLPLRDVI